MNDEQNEHLLVTVFPCGVVEDYAYYPHDDDCYYFHDSITYDLVIYCVKNMHPILTDWMHQLKK